MPAKTASGLFPPCGRAERQSLDNSQGVCCRKVARVTLEYPAHSFISFVLSFRCRFSIAVFFERWPSGERETGHTEASVLHFFISHYLTQPFSINILSIRLLDMRRPNRSIIPGETHSYQCQLFGLHTCSLKLGCTVWGKI